MSLLRNGMDLSEGLREFITNSKDLFIFVPYIKLETLKKLIAANTSCRAIIVRWEAKDLIYGASDIEVYQYCKERKIALFRNSRLHLKAYIDGYKKCIMGSPNISGRALNLPEGSIYNYELATLVDNLAIDDRLYFNIILNESTLVTDSIYEQIKSQLPEKERELPKESEFNFNVSYGLDVIKILDYQIVI